MAVALENATPRSSKPKSSGRCCARRRASPNWQQTTGSRVRYPPPPTPTNPHQLYQWRDTALQALTSLFSDQSAKEAAAREEAHAKQVHDLYAQIGKLTTQLEWLKKKSAASMSRDTRIGLLDSSTGRPRYPSQ